jgi:SAM-dependent methyltransferase
MNRCMSKRRSVRDSLPHDLCCMLCSGGSFRELLRRGDFHYLQCAGCGLVQLWPRPAPTQIIEAYEGYLSGDADEIETWRRMMQPVIVRTADLVCQMNPGGGRLLDLGCGYGFFLAEMARRSWQVQGVEIAPAGIRHARARLNLTVESEPLEHLEWPEKRFDVITLFYVIEHFGDPAAMLARLRRWLKPDGLLLLRWPHSTPIVRVLGPLAGRLDLYHTPFHMFDFSPSTIRMLLFQCGFDRITTTTMGGYTLPSRSAARLCSRLFGALGLALERLSGGRLLLPGLSKTTLARPAVEMITN